MNDFRKLKVWEKTIDFIAHVYELTNTFPDMERFGIISQTRRAVVSISCNISEGCGKTSKKDFNRFLEMALGSAYEVENLIIVCLKLEYISRNVSEVFISDIQEIERMIIGLKRNLV